MQKTNCIQLDNYGTIAWKYYCVNILYVVRDSVRHKELHEL